MSTENQKLSVYQAWKNGQSKASLALENDVSSRTIGRWIDEVAYAAEYAPAPTAVAEETKTVAKTADSRYLDAFAMKTQGWNNQEIADDLGVSVRTVGRWLEKAKAEVEQPEAKEEVQDSVTYRHVASSRSITITQLTNGKVTGSVTVDKSADKFDEIFDLLLSTNFAQESVAEAFLQLQPAKVLEKFSQGKLEIDPKNRTILFVPDQDTVPYEVHNSLVDRVLNMLREGDQGTQTLINFLEKLMENPSRRAVNELYGFLEHNDIEIAPSGNFYAWKKVQSNYLDIHSGTMDNSPGQTLKVARNMVDEDSNRTCSYGLHVCAKHYLPQFGSSYNNRIVKVEVHPADVVAVPADYNNAKMRTAGYIVLEDVTENFSQE